jgi:transcriptional regulator with XRE-family HTH domain
VKRAQGIIKTLLEFPRRFYKFEFSEIALKNVSETTESAQLALSVGARKARKVGKMLNGSYIKKWRKERHLSARELGQALGYRGRANVVKIEQGLTPLTAKFAARFEAFKNKTQAREYRERQIQTKYALPPKIKILARPQRCAICREWFIFPNAGDRVCTDRKCRRLFRAQSQAKAVR